MAARAELQEQWNAVALTKFRAPRLRRDVISRPELFERLLDSIEDNPVTLVCAPGGSGKTTLLAQLCAGQARDFTVLWASIDADDNDESRFFAALVQAVQPLALSWEIDPRALATNVGASKAHVRAALAALVNALCTTPARRVALILDDLHRIENPETFELLDSLIERLPDHIAVVLGSRVEPQLSLARWRAYGELGAFTAENLQFTIAEAMALNEARFGRRLDEGSIRDALSRTHGWAAGLGLLLQSKIGLHADVARAEESEPNRHLFAYLAQEVLHDLPEDLQEFLLRCSILLELSPTLCTALTDRKDARAVLESLYRRDLFLTTVDDVTPVLRFHDLFREFLETELAQRDPELKRTLHERAASAERIDSRAIYHLLAAQRWDEAMTRIAVAGQERLAHGGIATVERWIDSIPGEVRDRRPAIAYLSGTCAWLRGHYNQAKRELTLAVDGLTSERDNIQRVRAILHLVDALNSSGEQAAAMQRIEQASQLELDELGEAELALQRAWCVAPLGNPDAVAGYMREFATHVERDPQTICPVTAARIHCVLIGIPGIVGAFERFCNAYQQVRGDTNAPWHIAALTVAASVHLWRGRRAEALAAIADAEALRHQFGAFQLSIEHLGQLRTLADVAMGNHAAAITVMRRYIEGMQQPKMASRGGVWLRPYRHGLARACWVAQDVAGFREVLPHLIAPLEPIEWPFLDHAASIVRGHAAAFDEDWELAEQCYLEAVKTHDRLRMPMVHSDARIALAYSLLRQGRKADAWLTFRPAYDEVISERALGLLLIEPRRIVNALLDSAPAACKRTTEYGSLVGALDRWNAAPTAEPAARKSVLAALSERELEVLAEVAAGASNKHIARKLSLSLHTVKRHIANILDKIDCDSRGQAADLFRRAQAS
jgi:LuxR family transcriptional regulator, maltose regulon positive regulatory protein